jgi:hypothetical protein
VLQLQAGPSLADRLIENQARIDQLQLEQARLAFEFGQSGQWERGGFNSVIDWLRFNCHVTSTAAADLVNVGMHLPDMSETVKAMDSGDIGYAHVKVMARTADAVGPAFDETRLLGMARESSPGKFHYKCLHYRHSVDGHGFNEEQALLHQRRGLRLSTAEDGCLLISGGLDPVDGAAVRTALEALAKPCGREDKRTREQRLADGLTDICTNRTRQRVEMQVTASIESLLALVGAPGAEAEFSLPISAKTAQRWACDSSVSRILLQDSVVIDVGRAERTCKGPRRRALEARDKHCKWIGCERPASWCDDHHIVHWLHGGGGELDNQILLCRRHHRMFHEGGWQLIKTDEGRLLAMPPAVNFEVLPIHGEVAAKPPEGRGPD